MVVGIAGAATRGPRVSRPRPGDLGRARLVVAVVAVIYWLSDRDFDAGRGDFFYLADAFLHGRTWLDFQPGPYDVIIVDGRFYVPFAPFPAVALMPLVALIGPVSADQLEPGINAVLAAASVGLCWRLLGRIGVRASSTASGWSILFGFSTQILWVTTRGGVWHTGHLVATILTFACLIELWGRQRAWLIGLLAGAAFLTRAPLAFAIPFYALMLDRPVGCDAGAGGYVAGARTIPWRALVPARRSASCRRSSSSSPTTRSASGPAGVRLCAGDAAAVPRAAAGAGPVLARRTSG